MGKVRRRKFKDRLLQQFYDWFRDNKPGPELANKMKGSASNAYWVGRWGPDLGRRRPFAQPGSPAYAAWAAGVDDYREAQ